VAWPSVEQSLKAQSGMGPLDHLNALSTARAVIRPVDKPWILLSRIYPWDRRLADETYLRASGRWNWLYPRAIGQHRANPQVLDELIAAPPRSGDLPFRQRMLSSADRPWS
jgi:hypothetical protein